MYASICLQGCQRISANACYLCRNSPPRVWPSTRDDCMIASNSLSTQNQSAVKKLSNIRWFLYYLKVSLGRTPCFFFVFLTKTYSQWGGDGFAHSRMQYLGGMSFFVRNVLFSFISSQSKFQGPVYFPIALKVSETLKRKMDDLPSLKLTVCTWK